MEDREAILLLKAGDISGLEALVRRYQVRAVGAAYLICQDRALAEDTVQAAFVRVFERIHQFDMERAFGPWFLRSVTNDVLKSLARAGRHTPLEEGQVGPAGRALVSREPQPLEALENAETAEAVWVGIRQLPPAQRAVIVLRYYLDLSEAEISERLDSPPGTIKWRLHAARQRLRRLLPAWLWPAAVAPAGEQVSSAAVRGEEQNRGKR